MTRLPDKDTRADDRASRLQAQGIATKHHPYNALGASHVPFAHWLHMFAVCLLYAGAYILLLTQPDSLTRLLALTTLAFSCVQAGFIARDAGRMAATHRLWKARLIAQFFDTFLNAMSFSQFQNRRCPGQNRVINRTANVAARLQRFQPGYRSRLSWPAIALRGFVLKFAGLRSIVADPQSTHLDQLFLLLHLALWLELPLYTLGLADTLINYLLMTAFIGPCLVAILIIDRIGARIERER